MSTRPPLKILRAWEVNKNKRRALDSSRLHDPRRTELSWRLWRPNKIKLREFSWILKWEFLPWIVNTRASYSVKYHKICWTRCKMVFVCVAGSWGNSNAQIYAYLVFTYVHTHSTGQNKEFRHIIFPIRMLRWISGAMLHNFT